MFNGWYVNKLLKDFQLKYPAIVRDMKNCSHHYSSLVLNPFHLEGDCWTHTLLVCKQLEVKCDSKILKIVGLLHDIGKVFTRKENHEKGRVSFTNHEKWSAFLAVKFFEDYELNNSEKQELFELICLHGEPYKIPHDKMNSRLYNKHFLAQDLVIFGKADHDGRFYEKENDKHEVFKKDLPDSSEYNYTDKEVVFLIGLPGSGKSTYCKENFPGHFVVSRDDILMDGQTDYKKAWDSANQQAVNAKLEQRFKDSLKQSKVVVDMTNLTRKHRMARLEKYKDFNKKAVVLVPDLITLFERNNSRKHKAIDYSVIKKMIESFYPPLFDEGYCDIKYIFG